MTVPRPQITRVCIIGLGNTLAGDDGAGVAAVERLRIMYADQTNRNDLSFHILSGDLYGVTDLLSPVHRLVFIDAIEGIPPGRLQHIDEKDTAVPAVSLHQLDIVTVMHSLARLELCSPFPRWEIRCITIKTPSILTGFMSSPVEHAVDRLISELSEEINSGFIFLAPCLQ